MTSVLDIPVWEGCPHRGAIPARYEIRKGVAYGESVCVIYDPEHDLHVSIVIKKGALRADRIEAAVSNLAGAAFEQEFPGKFSHMIRADALDIGSHNSPEWARYRELHGIPHPSAAPLQAASGAGPGIPRNPA